MAPINSKEKKTTKHKKMFWFFLLYVSALRHWTMSAVGIFKIFYKYFTNNFHLL